MESGSMKPSPLDLLSAILTGKFGVEGMSQETGAALIAENRQLLMILTTSIAVLVGCAIVFVWRRSTGKKASRPVEPPRPLVVKTDLEPEVDDGKKKVTIFFGTQTGTAEGFARVHNPWCDWYLGGGEGGGIGGLGGLRRHEADAGEEGGAPSNSIDAGEEGSGAWVA